MASPRGAVRVKHLLSLSGRPTHRRSVLGDVQNIIEDAVQKDSRIMKTHKRLSTRLGLNVRTKCTLLPLCQ